MATPDTEVIGEHEFKVQACANDECGVWSEPLNFDFTAMNAPRFTDHGDGTVTDNNTQLMWTQEASPKGPQNWVTAMHYCERSTMAGHTDWGLATLSELKSLVDKTQTDPALPQGNPFYVPTGLYGYWTSTTSQYDIRYAWVVDLYIYSVESWIDKRRNEYYWCKRRDD